MITGLALTAVPLYRCTAVPLYRCTAVPLYRCTAVPLCPKAGFVGDGAGGTFFFCGEGGEERPILYADSEGGAALVAIGLAELLLVVPWWRDCQAFTDEESRELEAE
ncbi:hypothetical protein [Streptomyces aureus]|uniref:hypothetical protein n=1 Tax=Streptomyces aureus TaxID=193461 RepID=UPI001FD75FC0|nr:hypothetical protein [Streptomyces aureus]